MPHRVLVVGGSSYLGQFVARELAKQDGMVVGVTSHLTECTIPGIAPEHRYTANVLTPGELAGVLSGFQPTAVVNCVAQADLGSSEKDPPLAERLNSPTWLSGLPAGCFCIHISTDIVYQGGRPWSTEDQANPGCVYGRTKLDGERFIIESLPPPHIVLRSALIYGPPPFLSSQKASFVQGTQKSILEGKTVCCFSDEFRTPVYVFDIAAVIAAALARVEGGEVPKDVFNMGGPDRASRVDMAGAVVSAMGRGGDLIRETSLKDINFGYNRPADVSMDSSRLREWLPEVKWTSLNQAVREVVDGRS